MLVRELVWRGYRRDAERAIDTTVGQLGGLHPASTTTRVPLLGADGYTARWNQRHLLAQRAGVHVAAPEHLLQRYGSGVDVLIDAIRRRPELGRPLPGAEDYLAVEVWFAVVHEGASQLRDVLVRRTRIAMETWDGGAEAAGTVARLMATELGWTTPRPRARSAATCVGPPPTVDRDGHRVAGVVTGTGTPSEGQTDRDGHGPPAAGRHARAPARPSVRSRRRWSG